MNQQEHVSTARELTERADEESRNGGNELIAAEFLWGAFAHCLIGIALNQGLAHDSHGTFERIARHLDAAQGSNTWRSCFGSAERLHAHFYHGNLPVRELRTHTQAAGEGIQDLLNLLRIGN